MHGIGISTIRKHARNARNRASQCGLMTVGSLPWPGALKQTGLIGSPILLISLTKARPVVRAGSSPARAYCRWQGEKLGERVGEWFGNTIVH
jgi:hypothetical protein